MFSRCNFPLVQRPVKRTDARLDNLYFFNRYQHTEEILPMYELFYHLERRPFVLTPDPDYFYRSKSCQKALNLLELGLTNELALNVLLGDVGIGKTSIIQHFVGQLPHNYIAGVVAMHEEQSTEKLLREALITLGVVDYSNEKRDIRGQWRKFVKGKSGDSRKRVLIIDDAEYLSFDALNALLAFIKQRTHGRKNLHIILVGHWKLVDKYKDSYLQAFINSAGLSYRVQPLNHQETDEYIQYRLKTAGAEKTQVLDYLALDAVYQYSEGVPRIINFLCDTAFGYGYAERKKRIDKFLVDKSAFKLKRSLELEVSGSKKVERQVAPNKRSSGDAGIGVTLKRGAFEGQSKTVKSSGSPLPVFSTEKKAVEPSKVKLETVSRDNQPDFEKVPLVGTYVTVKPRSKSAYRSAAVVACSFILATAVIFYLLPGDRDVSMVAIADRPEDTHISQVDGKSLVEKSYPLDVKEGGGIPDEDKDLTSEESHFSAVIPSADKLIDNSKLTVVKPLNEISSEEAADNVLGMGKGLDGVPDSKGVPSTAVSLRRVEAKEEGPRRRKDSLDERIQGLIDLAERQLDARKLTFPVNDNAYTTYTQLLEISPDDERALAGIRRVGENYLALAQSQLTGKNYQKSLDLTDKGLKIIPDDAQLLALKRQVALKQRQAKSIGILLARAENQLDDLKLTWPKTDNAYETYQQVLVMEKNNKRAAQGLDRIVQQYMDITLKAEEVDDLESALDYSEQALLVDPGHVRFREKRQEILATIKTKTAEEAKISQLLDQAGQQIQNRQVINPEGDNAVESYKKILQVDPENQQASMGLEVLAQQYEMLIRRKISEDDRKQASIMVEQGINKFLDPVRFKGLKKLLRQPPPKVVSSDAVKRVQSPGQSTEKPKSQRRFRSFGTF